MGTNYYLVTPGRDTPDSGDINKIHIGKQSAGWKFLFHAVSLPMVTDLLCANDWFRYLEQPMCVVVDEYGDYLTGPQMRDKITEHQNDDLKDHVGTHEYQDSFGFNLARGEFS